MKKKTICTLLIAALLLSGCGNNQKMPAETTAAEMEETTVSTPETTAETTAPETTAVKEEPKEISLSELPESKFDIKSFDFMCDNGHKLVSGSFEISKNGHIFASRQKLEFTESGETLIRESCNGGSLEKDDENILKRAESKKYTPAYSYNSGGVSPYEMNMDNPVVIFDSITEESMSVGSYKVGYSMYPGIGKKSIYVNAFIKYKNKSLNKDEYYYEVIIDPAYMYGIPLFNHRAEDMSFNINGLDYTADTLYLSGISGTAPLWDVDDSQYVYAKLSATYIDCQYDSVSGYKNRCFFDISALISEDVESVLTSPLTMSGDYDKDPKMTEAYNAIIDNRETLDTENTFGITLLDMDYDGMPEILASRLDYDGKKGLSNFWQTDVDIYKVENGSLKYIDTINNAHQVVYDITNYLGEVTLEDGTKGWFATAYKNRDNTEKGQTDYVYVLEGDKLRAIEIFSSKGEGEDVVYYYMGKEIVLEVTIGVDPYYDESSGAPEDFPWEYVSYNGQSATFGVWELYGFLRQDYCKNNVGNTYYLYSDWLGDPHTGEKFDLSERDFSHNIAYIVDSFFIGEYNINEKQYHYYFLGDYAKPVIYLYPEEETEISVAVDFKYGGELTCTYPEYKDGWKVTAMPDGTLYDENGDEYYCLYWEADGNALFDNSKGFCVKGEDTAKFLREKLVYIGLTAREANEFIIYWLPKLQDNKYNVITLHTEDYADSVPLTLSVQPDTMIRVFMTYYSSDKPVEIEEQELPHYERTGFTLVEWGGSEE